MIKSYTFGAAQHLRQDFGCFHLEVIQRAIQRDSKAKPNGTAVSVNGGASHVLLGDQADQVAQEPMDDMKSIGGRWVAP